MTELQISLAIIGYFAVCFFVIAICAKGAKNDNPLHDEEK